MVKCVEEFSLSFEGFLTISNQSKAYLLNEMKSHIQDLSYVFYGIKIAQENDTF
jgi:hypothetical protein